VEPKPERMTTVLLLGASLMGLGGLLWLWSIDEPLPSTDILVHQKIIAPDGQLVFNGTILLTPANGTVLGALLYSAEIGGFDVNVTYSYMEKAFVQEIAGYRNKGACGWVYDHNGVRGPRSADEEVLANEDLIRWGWDCEG
jgi:hypothetical protein